MRTYSQSQTKINLTSSEFLECSRCKFGECHLWAVNSWKKYLNPVCVAILCPVFPHQPICGFTCLQKFHFAFLSWGLEMQPLGHSPVLNRFEGNDSLKEPWGLCPCHVCVLDWESHGFKKNLFYPYFSRIKQVWQTVPWIWQIQFFIFLLNLFLKIDLIFKRYQKEIFLIWAIYP